MSRLCLRALGGAHNGCDNEAHYAEYVAPVLLVGPRGRRAAGPRRADGIILADLAPTDARSAVLQELETPFVAFERMADYREAGYPFVDVDGTAGFRGVIAYLVSQGDRRMAYLSGPLTTSYALHRYHSYMEGLAKHDQPASGGGSCTTRAMPPPWPAPSISCSRGPNLSGRPCS